MIIIMVEPKKKKKKKKQLGVEEGGVGEGSLLHKF
jgi:hypothetical protein